MSEVTAGPSTAAGLKGIGRVAEEIAVTHARGNLQKAAAGLGVTDRTLHMRRSAHPERAR